MKSPLQIAVFLIVSSLTCTSLHAAGKSKAVKASRKTRPVSAPVNAAGTPKPDSGVLDFKDQVIEGSVLDSKSESGARKSSPLFTGLGSGDNSMDSIVFKRSDFNDFHNVQMKQRVYVQSADGK